MTFLHHIDITTGRSRRAQRSEVAETVLDVVGPWLDQAMLADNPLKAPPVALPVPELAEFSAHIYPSPGGLVVTVYGPDILTVPPAPSAPIPLVTFGVARRERNAKKLWDYLVQTTPGLRFPPAMPGVPWLGAVPYQTLQFFPDASWLADFESCVAWAWIERVAD